MLITHAIGALRYQKEVIERIALLCLWRVTTLLVNLWRLPTTLTLLQSAVVETDGTIASWVVYWTRLLDSPLKANSATKTQYAGQKVFFYPLGLGFLALGF